MASRKIQDKARKIAAHLLEAAPEDLVWEPGKFSVKGAPDRAKTIQEIAFAAYTNHPQGMEAGLEAVSYYDPPNLTYPFGSYICVVDIDKGTGEVKVRRFVAIDDCGNIINPMIVQGQVHGGLTMGLAPALFEEISYDEIGNIQGGSFIDYLVPTAVETPKWETGHTVTPSPHHPLGAKGVGESATVGAPAAIANAVVDALWHLGVRHVDIPITPPKVWRLLRDERRHRVALARSARAGRRPPAPWRAFALATVVRCERPTSAKPGAKALIRPDGSVAGWVGGACAEPVVAREALAALRDGHPRLVVLVGDGGRDPARTEGIVHYPMTCHSGGTLEIYVEPFLPKALLVLVGHGPVIETLATLAQERRL